jgi:hypothetical protein
LYITCFLLYRDDEEPPKDDTTAPSMSHVTAVEPAEQVVAPRVTRASVKKIPETRSNKRSKKAKEPDVSLEAHASTVSPNDVSNFFFSLACFPLHTLVLLHALSLLGIIEEIRHLRH